ncbi:MAG: AraC family transcriptional regulator [Actinobacteria bacterium]|nr:AraC family transcriptional regulator [Actinomycetota bacterium]
MTDTVRAWHPGVPFVREVLHASFDHHAYPRHTHDDWTVLLVDEGAVTYDLEGARHGALPGAITILPPGVPHDGRSALRDRGFCKRVLYLDAAWLPDRCIGAAAGAPTVRNVGALSLVAELHDALASPGDNLAAETAVLSLGDALRDHFGQASNSRPDVPLARRLRALLDDGLHEKVTIAEAAQALGVHPSHLVRAFSQAYGIPPHRYVTGRRVDAARHLIAQGTSIAQAAVEVGFHDQAHLTRHFRRILGATPGAFAA